MFGNGGYAGENLDAPLQRALSGVALRSGFLTVQTNTSHDATREPSAVCAAICRSWWLAFQAVHEASVRRGAPPPITARTSPSPIRTAAPPAAARA